MLACQLLTENVNSNFSFSLFVLPFLSFFLSFTLCVLPMFHPFHSSIHYIDIIHCLHNLSVIAVIF